MYAALLKELNTDYPETRAEALPYVPEILLQTQLYCLNIARLIKILYPHFKQQDAAVFGRIMFYLLRRSSCDIDDVENFIQRANITVLCLLALPPAKLQLLKINSNKITLAFHILFVLILIFMQTEKLLFEICLKKSAIVIILKELLAMDDWDSGKVEKQIRDNTSHKSFSQIIGHYEIIFLVDVFGGNLRSILTLDEYLDENRAACNLQALPAYNRYSEYYLTTLLASQASSKDSIPVPPIGNAASQSTVSSTGVSTSTTQETAPNVSPIVGGQYAALKAQPEVKRKTPTIDGDYVLVGAEPRMDAIETSQPPYSAQLRY